MSYFKGFAVVCNGSVVEKTWHLFKADNCFIVRVSGMIITVYAQCVNVLYMIVIGF